jgi:hypothetical protein
MNATKKSTKIDGSSIVTESSRSNNSEIPEMNPLGWNSSKIVDARAIETDPQCDPQYQSSDIEVILRDIQGINQELQKIISFDEEDTTASLQPESLPSNRASSMSNDVDQSTALRTFTTDGATYQSDWIKAQELGFDANGPLPLVEPARVEYCIKDEEKGLNVKVVLDPACVKQPNPIVKKMRKNIDKLNRSALILKNKRHEKQQQQCQDTRFACW